MPAQVILNNRGMVRQITSPVQGVADLPAYMVAGNYGAAVDAGILYDYSDRLTLSASILDLGFIWWRKNLTALSQKETFVFSGFDLDTYIRTGTQADLLTALEDSISKNFSLSQSSGSYVALIPTRIFGAAGYHLNSRLEFGSVVELEILSGTVSPGLTFTAVSRPVDGLALSLSYSLMDRAYNNLGFGLVAGSHPVQFFFVTDHIPASYVKDKNSGLIWPYRARTMNVRLGFSVLLGCQDNRPGYRKPEEASTVRPIAEAAGFGTTPHYSSSVTSTHCPVRTAATS